MVKILVVKKLQKMQAYLKSMLRLFVTCFSPKDWPYLSWSNTNSELCYAIMAGNHRA